MRPIAFVADVHVGNHRRFGGPATAGVNRRCREALDVLRGAVDCAADAGCVALVVAGDLFDTPKPEPQIIAATAAVLTHARARCLDVHLLVGNHEQATEAVGDHALGPLGAIPGVAVYDAPTGVRVGDAYCALLPYRARSGKRLPEDMTAAVGQAARFVEREAVAVVAHVGIAHAATPRFLATASDAIPLDAAGRLLDAADAMLLVAGHWHTHASLRPATADASQRVVQLGALCPTGWDNPGDDYGHVWLWSGGTNLRVLARAPGPRFLRLGLDEATRLAPDPGLRVYLRLAVAPEEVRAGGDLLDAMIADGRVVAGELELARAVHAPEVAAAVRNVRAPDSLEEAVAEFVGGMAVPDGADRARIGARALTYLRGGHS